MSLTMNMPALDFLIEVMFILKVIKSHFNHIALRKAKIAYTFGLSECRRVKGPYDKQNFILMVISYAMYETRHRLIS